jgi:endonuclease/exonuclease/phosphatase family metal-dependent hydrolase
MILTKYPSKFLTVEFETRMGRSLLVAEPINGIEGKPVCVATAHFESLASARLRNSQMKTTFNIFDQVKCDAIVCGDFNFDNSWPKEPEVFKSAGYEDIISQFDDQGFTMFPSGKFKAWRPDKILHKGTVMTAVDAHICGNFSSPLFAAKGEKPEKITHDGMVRTPSDHMAVIGDFKLN